MSVLKNTLIISLFPFIFYSCSSKPGKGPDPGTAADTLIYLPPPSQKLSEAEILHYRSAIGAFFDSVMVPRGFNGSIIVAKKGTVLFEKYYGYSDLDRKDSLTEHSAFHLASVSKTFTAMSILRLAEKGKLELNDDIRKFFPAFPYEGIEVKHLLSHRSGLPNYMYFLQSLGWDQTEFSSNADVLDYLIKFKPELNSKPGTKFNYCNTNFVLLALIIEKVTGRTYGDHLQKTIFGPLGMSDTYVFTLKDSNRAMPSYDGRGRKEALTFLDAEYGDKNIYTTPRDLLKWDQALYTEQFLGKKSLEAAFTPYSNERPGIKNYGYGWRMDIFPGGKKLIFHGGWWHGNNTLFVRAIEDSATIIVLGNKKNRVVYDAKFIANIFSPYFTTDDPEKINQEEDQSTRATDNLPKETDSFPAHQKTK